MAIRTEDTKRIGDQIYYHESGESFGSRDDARRHAEQLKKDHAFIKRTAITKRPNGSYWVWYSWQH